MQAKKAERPKPKAKAKKAVKKKKKAFYSDDEETEDSEEEEEEEDEFTPHVPEDLGLLLRVTLPLLRSRNSGVVLAVAALHHYVGPRDRAIMARNGRALVRIMRGHREIQYIVLTNIVEFAKQNPDTFRKYLKDFFVAVRADAPCARACLCSCITLLLLLRALSHCRSRSRPLCAA
ncbi:hypothetical protein EON66_05760 [archaeon]|nr:MAG: hypothetical protein EON66_05760 [archaeon]